MTSSANGAVVDAEGGRRLVLWRHGRTAWNHAGRAQGHADIGLDAVGVAQAERAAAVLSTYRPSFIWTSDLTRARQTAERLEAQTGQEIVLDERLREKDVGAREGMTFEEVAETFPEEYAVFAAGGELHVSGAETLADVGKRMVAVLTDAMSALAEEQTGVLVGHGLALRVGLMAFFSVPTPLQDMLAGMSNCAWTVLEQRVRRGWQIVDYNAQTLPEPLDLPDDPNA